MNLKLGNLSAATVPVKESKGDQDPDEPQPISAGLFEILMLWDQKNKDQLASRLSCLRQIPYQRLFKFTNTEALMNVDGEMKVLKNQQAFVTMYFARHLTVKECDTLVIKGIPKKVEDATPLFPKAIFTILASALDAGLKVCLKRTKERIIEDEKEKYAEKKRQAALPSAVVDLGKKPVKTTTKPDAKKYGLKIANRDPPKITEAEDGDKMTMVYEAAKTKPAIVKNKPKSKKGGSSEGSRRGKRSSSNPKADEELVDAWTAKFESSTTDNDGSRAKIEEYKDLWGSTYTCVSKCPEIASIVRSDFKKQFGSPNSLGPLSAVLSKSAIDLEKRMAFAELYYKEAARASSGQPSAKSGKKKKAAAREAEEEGVTALQLVTGEIDSDGELTLDGEEESEAEEEGKPLRKRLKKNRDKEEKTEDERDEKITSLEKFAVSSRPVMKKASTMPGAIVESDDEDVDTDKKEEDAAMEAKADEDAMSLASTPAVKSVTLASADDPEYQMFLKNKKKS